MPPFENLWADAINTNIYLNLAPANTQDTSEEEISCLPHHTCEAAGKVGIIPRYPLYDIYKG